jgi:hypothetical protein
LKADIATPTSARSACQPSPIRIIKKLVITSVVVGRILYTLRAGKRTGCMHPDVVRVKTGNVAKDEAVAA